MNEIERRRNTFSGQIENVRIERNRRPCVNTFTNIREAAMVNQDMSKYTIPLPF